LQLKELIGISIRERKLADGAFIDHRRKLRGGGLRGAAPSASFRSRIEIPINSSIAAWSAVASGAGHRVWQRSRGRGQREWRPWPLITIFTVNGGDGNDQFAGLPAIQPSPDAIEEFRVLTNTFDAEYGRNPAPS